MSDSTVVSPSSRALLGAEASSTGARSAWASLREAWRGAPRSAAQDVAAWRRLALQLHHDLPRAEAPRVVLLTTATPSAEAARGAATLAECLADELGRPVLLADAGREAALGGLLSATAPAGRGFLDLLAGAAPAAAGTLPTSHPLVSFLPAGRADAGAAADHFTAFQTVMAARYDFVVLAAGPVLSESLALALAPWVGCVLLVAVEHQTRVTDLDAAEAALAACRARKVGLVLAAGER